MNAEVLESPHDEPAEVTQEDINNWYIFKQKLSEYKDLEIALRKKIAAFYFRDPHEGTNTIDMTDGFVMKMGHTINRKIDEAAFSATKERLRELGVDADTLVRFKPELVKSVWNAMTPEIKEVTAEFIIEDVGTPSLEIMQPKKRGKKK